MRERNIMDNALSRWFQVYDARAEDSCAALGTASFLDQAGCTLLLGHLQDGAVLVLDQAIVVARDGDR